MLLGVNVDHVATLREARGTAYPSPLQAALLAEKSGADSITIHLREDRRHIQDQDVLDLCQHLSVRVNLEMAVTDEMVQFACDLKPSDCCLVPEKRAELTTEGGLDVLANLDTVKAACQQLKAVGIRVSLFIDPERDQIEATAAVGARVIELHTGSYADAPDKQSRQIELDRIIAAAGFANSLGMTVHAGHGLNTANVTEIARIPEIVELNIGHSIIADSVFMGLGKAVADIKKLMLMVRTQ
ncbi:MAG: pyridoxine 5'-phosphate synthase [Gammaproteobacteria bacterium]|nr:pyridoxine 5'-phosphate synthase [Gammaproteobacteria bacterium]MCP4088788.1 pyridoxine 5'-phosphate synthase [Gammaproteobacteria bacterium]MCP4275913.1 pyridoxine 5'-phosphate synthase [Gammaproteobacteria bacterium]MCP4832129.1 pyridoxine 5'-phosphate synthase [Gammaproteobacteria bacterium]MCP4928270.1 pyridoxine 5'-phosphate synthase [Gammaproteobacteria bacterium]